jgi:hypothetical protein
VSAISQLPGGFAGNSVADRSSGIPFWIFILLQIALIGYAAFAVRRARLAALALTVFSASYALFALFVGGMAFSNTWL